MGFRLPDGTYTASSSKYVKAWKAITVPIEKRFNCKVIGFDPSLRIAHYSTNNEHIGGSFDMPLWFAKKLVSDLL